MKNIFLISLLLVSLSSFAQEKKLYDPTADAVKDIAAAVTKAKTEHKYVLIQAGGNWCKWCIEFARFAQADKQIDSVMNSSFVWYHLNFSQENKNEKVFATLGYPQRFGFPVFVILDENGKRLNTQNSSYLENGNSSYD